MAVAGQAAAVAILGKRHPSGEERPHRSLVIADGIIEAHARTEIARAPIGGKFRRRPAVQHSARTRQLESPIPIGYCGIDSRTGIEGAIGVSAEGVKVRIREEVFFFQLLRDMAGWLLV